MNPTSTAVQLRCADADQVARLAEEARNRASQARRLGTALSAAQADAVSGGLRALNPGDASTGDKPSVGGPRLPLPTPFPMPGPVVVPLPPITVGMVGVPGVPSPANPVR
jgi:hypothetical protein